MFLLLPRLKMNPESKVCLIYAAPRLKRTGYRCWRRVLRNTPFLPLLICSLFCSVESPSPPAHSPLLPEFCLLSDAWRLTWQRKERAGKKCWRERERRREGEKERQRRASGWSYSLITCLPCKCSSKELHRRLQETATPFQIIKYWPIKVRTWGWASSSSLSTSSSSSSCLHSIASISSSISYSPFPLRSSANFV